MVLALRIVIKKYCNLNFYEYDFYFEVENQYECTVNCKNIVSLDVEMKLLINKV